MISCGNDAEGEAARRRRRSSASHRRNDDRRGWGGQAFQSGEDREVYGRGGDLRRTTMTTRWTTTMIRKGEKSLFCSNFNFEERPSSRSTLPRRRATMTGKRGLTSRRTTLARRRATEIASIAMTTRRRITSTRRFSVQCIGQRGGKLHHHV